jgi:hypothetical protein
LSQGHQIDDAHGDSALEKCGAFRDENVAVFRSVLVCWADDLDGSEKPTPAPHVQDPNLVIIKIGQRGFDGHAWLWRSPDDCCHSALIFTHRGLEHSVALECRDIDFHLRAGVNSWLGDITRW